MYMLILFLNSWKNIVSNITIVLTSNSSYNYLLKPLQNHVCVCQFLLKKKKRFQWQCGVEIDATDFDSVKLLSFRFIQSRYLALTHTLYYLQYDTRLRNP